MKRDIYDWCFHLIANPEDYADCPFDDFTGTAWAFILRECPQFADRCDWTKLSKFNIETLLLYRPEFINQVDLSQGEQINLKRLNEKNQKYKLSTDSIGISKSDKEIYDFLKVECEKYGSSKKNYKEIAKILNTTYSRIIRATRRLRAKNLIHAIQLNGVGTTIFMTNNECHVI